MFVQDYRKDFYDLLRGKRVLMLANFDVDSLASVKILQHLFRMDNIMHVLAPVSGYAEVKKHYSDYADEIIRVLLINCGGAADIVHMLQEVVEVPSETIFFIIDSHRPFSLLNIYDDTKQVRILGHPDHEQFPSFDDLFIELSEDEDSSDSDEESDQEEDIFNPNTESRVAKRAARRVKKAQKEKKRREFENRRSKVVLDYSEYNYFGKPSSIIALDVALGMSKANSEVVWWALIGVSDCVRLNKLDRSVYTVLMSLMQQHVNKVAHENQNTLFDLKIAMKNDLDSYIYRCWTVYDSMKMSPNWVCNFKLWTVTGEQRFKLFLAETGLPLREVKIGYEYMSIDIRKELENSIRSREDKYNIQDWTIATFEARYGYLYRFTALDIHMACLGILNSTTQKYTKTQKFQCGLDCLAKESTELVSDGHDLAKVMLNSIYEQMKYLVSMDQISTIGSVLVASIGVGRFEYKYNIRPSFMHLLVRFAQRAFIASKRSSRYKNMPFLLMAPLTEDTVVAIGIPPFSVDATHNVFGKVFETVSAKMKNSIIMDGFDPSLCQFKLAVKEAFIENVIATMS